MTKEQDGKYWYSPKKENEQKLISWNSKSKVRSFDLKFDSLKSWELQVQEKRLNRIKRNWINFFIPIF